MVVGGGVTAFLLGYVVPKFSLVYQGSGRELPFASQWLLAWGQWFASNQVLIVAVAVPVVGLLLKRLWDLKRSGTWWTALRWIPGAKGRVHVLELSRLYLTLGMLLEGGIPINRVMQLAVAVVPLSRREAWDQVRHAVNEGKGLSTALELNGFSSPVAARLLRVGERSGQMGAMLSKTASFHDAETSRWFESFTKAFEPVLMAVIGLAIGLIVVLLYMPIFDLAGSLQ